MQIAVANIRDPKVLLRTVDTGSVEFQELMDSIHDRGVLKPLLVRPFGAFYELIDGMHRLMAVRMLDLLTVDVKVIDCDDNDALLLQLQANAIQVPTSPVDYARRLRHHMDLNPTLTLSGLARVLNKSTQWVRQILGLLGLSEDARKAVERGEISLRSAYELRKLPHPDQDRWLPRAVVCSAKQFVAEIAPAVRAYVNGRQQGRYVRTSGEPKAYLRSLKEIQHELENENEASAVITVEGAKNSLDGFKAALKWVLHLDNFTIRKRNEQNRNETERDG
jgi:ParB/RepB/Spo0J family partition protein